MHRQKNASIYEFRSRKLLPAGDDIFDSTQVNRLDHDVWEVRVEYLLEEHVKGGDPKPALPLPAPDRALHSAAGPQPLPMAFDCCIPPGPRPVDSREGMRMKTRCLVSGSRYRSFSPWVPWRFRPATAPPRPT